MRSFKKISLLFCLAVLQFLQTTAQTLPRIKISANKRFFVTADNKPFFWLGDTGWLLFSKLNMKEAEQYLEDRKQKGFNVIQVMLLHELNMSCPDGDHRIPALIDKNVAKPNVTKGYDYWDRVDEIVKLAEQKGLYMALVPVWGGNVKSGGVNSSQAKAYASFLANHFKNMSNIIWMDGGDIKGSDSIEVWRTIGATLKANDPGHLITFHPRGRSTSSTWFHNEPWLDFNMFQSGHKDYAQDTTEPRIGEDNWKFAENDYALSPTKPTIDGEPSYEGIPHGLHEANQPYWTDNDVRRYAYWSVFAGGAGFTYGHNAVMQFYSAGDAGTSFFPKVKWQEGMQAPGSSQMQYLKQLMLSKPYLERIPDQTLVIDNGEKYNRVISTRGKTYAMFYVYNARKFKVALNKLKFIPKKATWFSAVDSQVIEIKDYKYTAEKSFDPPGEKVNGNDWVLILEK